MNGHHTTFYWIARPRYMVAAWVTACVAFAGHLWLIKQQGLGDAGMLPYLFGLLFSGWYLQTEKLVILTDGVLGLSWRAGHARYVPLTAAAITRRGRWLVLRWQNGRVKRRLTLGCDPEFDPLLHDAVVRAQALTDQRALIPTSDLEAARFAPVGWTDISTPRLLFIVALSALIMIADGLNQPLVLLLLPLLGEAMVRYFPRKALVLTSDGLWVTRPRALPVILPTYTISTIGEARRALTKIRTPHAKFPILELNPITNAGFIQALKRPPLGAAPSDPAAASPTAPI